MNVIVVAGVSVRRLWYNYFQLIDKLANWNLKRFLQFKSEHHWSWGSGFIVPLTLSPSTRRSRVGRLRDDRFRPGQMISGTQWIDWKGLSFCLGEEQILLYLPGVEPRFLGRPARSLDSRQATLSRLQPDVIKISWQTFCLS
jgi:hypothetical protein